MSKRFTDTEIWSEDWFLELEPEYMFLWKYLTDDCDHAGIWKPNKIKFQKLTGFKIDLENALCVFNNGKERIVVLKNGRWLLAGFIPFQYGRSLNLANRVHKSIYDILLKNEVKLTSIRPQIEVTQGVKDKDKDKDKDKKREGIVKGRESKEQGKGNSRHFADIWKEYPNKVDRSRAEKAFLSTVINDDDYEKCKLALVNYLKHLEENEWKQAQNGATWFKSWHDWLDYKKHDQFEGLADLADKNCMDCLGSGVCVAPGSGKRFACVCTKK